MATRAYTKNGMSSEPGEYVILPVKEEDSEEVMEFLKRTFFVLEPLNMGVGLCQRGERCEELERYCSAALLGGFSLRAAAAAAGGATVAVTLSGSTDIREDRADELEHHAEHCTDPKFSRVLRVLARREAAAAVRLRDLPCGRTLEVKVAATDPAWSRRGIMTDLLARTEQLARSRDVTVLRMDTSSAYSARAAERRGFVRVSRMRYAEVTLRGEPLARPPPPHRYDDVYVKILDAA